jgi:2-amino-4-hydroxy-6-hydroxymethyldihydropteridine diphosphokinase
MNNIVFSIGSNLGNRFQNLQQSCDLITERVGPVVRYSSVYETPAWGFNGKAFLNAVIQVRSSLQPEQVLIEIQNIEKSIGRQQKSINGIYQNRPIDIDILYFNDWVIDKPQLRIPHPYIQERNFVLYPLVEILPGFFHPVLQKSNKELLSLSPDKNTAVKIDKTLKNREIPYNFIAVEGNIGAGKTTFSKMFSQDFNTKLVLERFEENAFLPKFYEDPKRYAFPLEMSFLADRYQQLSDDLAQYDLFKTAVISDYYVFKSLIFSKVTLTDDEYALYRKIFNFMYKDLIKPDLYVYLYQNVERLLQNIKKRGRTYEQSIQPEYLEQIHKGYMNFIKTQKDLNVLILDISNIDFVENPDYYQKMVQHILTPPSSQKMRIVDLNSL